LEFILAVGSFAKLGAKPFGTEKIELIKPIELLNEITAEKANKQ